MVTDRMSFDDDGDVVFQVNCPDKLVILLTVCSRSLRRVSSVFRQILSTETEGVKSRETTAAKRIINLTADKPEALITCMNIIHGHMDKIPKILSVDSLYELTVLADSYHVSHLLAPWIHTWMAGIEDILRDAKSLQPKALWITWELDQKEMLEVTVSRMLVESSATDFSEGAAIHKMQMPPYIIKYLMTGRKRTIDSLLNPIRKILNRMLSPDEDHRWCRHATYMAPRLCESMVLGSLAFSLARVSLWPLPETGKIESSVIDLYGKLVGLCIEDIGRVKGEVMVKVNGKNYRSQQTAGLAINVKGRSVKLSKDLVSLTPDQGFILTTNDSIVADPRQQVYTPTAQAGHRLPHVWLERGGKLLSTHDLAGPDGSMLLIIDGEEPSWAQGAQEAAKSRSITLQIARIVKPLHRKRGEEFCDINLWWAQARGAITSGGPSETCSGVSLEHIGSEAQAVGFRELEASILDRILVAGEENRRKLKPERIADHSSMSRSWLEPNPLIKRRGEKKMEKRIQREPRSGFGTEDPSASGLC
ncbi:uncharacterized protein NECHADRAFT_88838 [Fusarium vanettenii 77-13-4]|uniref:BTB domain-containing protein n=1 Tax=Fusarium vanettenii (strain ATCC MYA-4622 / CBS 123669 / FGSC 9596 / NRRL 45880 / 77-13-4) TaxID=660122 RepID=C7ZN58_FUSV7|nr:uncharacterized protein NECHADRAFT_88838 [Fusarium vanettenii 77-13-4]EEU34541.1 predicted protein [Fusarium vanettenii 77-13-4]